MTPDARVTTFVNAMAKWERRVFKKIGRSTPAETATLKKELEAIFNENLTTKGRSRTRFGVRLTSGLTAAQPPKFDQMVAGVEEGLQASQFYVVTKHRKDPNKIWRYIVVESNGTLAIDDMQTRLLSKAESQEVAKGRWDKLPKGQWEKLAY